MHAAPRIFVAQIAPVRQNEETDFERECSNSRVHVPRDFFESDSRTRKRELQHGPEPNARERHRQ